MSPEIIDALAFKAASHGVPWADIIAVDYSIIADQWKPDGQNCGDEFR